MSLAQRVILSLVPRSWAASMEADSRRWICRCPCGHERSIWDLGGIRWKAAGEPRKWLRCPPCGKRTWHRVSWRAAQPAETRRASDASL
jgi:hypothetical protein